MGYYSLIHKMQGGFKNHLHKGLVQTPECLTLKKTSSFKLTGVQIECILLQKSSLRRNVLSVQCMYIVHSTYISKPSFERASYFNHQLQVTTLISGKVLLVFEIT